MTKIIHKMTRQPVGIELMATPLRLSVLGLIARGINDLGNCNEGQSVSH
jgi:hypothetical protein